MADKFGAIIFDFDNTLVDYVSSDILALTQVAKSLPISIEPEVFVDKAVEQIMAFHDLYDRGEVIGEDIHIYRLSHTVKYLGLDWDPKYLDVYLDCYLNNLFVYPGVSEMLTKIHSSVRTGLITNSYLIAEQTLRIERSGLAEYFDEVLICGEIDCYKPDPRAFIHLADKFGLDPEECLYVGDSEKHDVLGAKDAGMGTVRVVHGSPKNLKSKADYICIGIPELAQLLSKLLDYN